MSKTVINEKKHMNRGRTKTKKWSWPLC